MDTVLQELRARPLIFVGGKGGVGKTTHAASLACRLADAGSKVLLVSTDPAHSLGDVLDIALSDTPKALTAHLYAMELDPANMVEQHFEQVLSTIGAYAKPEMLPRLKQHLEAAKAAPGAEEAAMLEAICRYIVNYQSLGFDHIVFDTAPTGHTLRLLELPQMMAAWTEGLLAQQGRQQELQQAALSFWQKSGKENTLLSEGRQQRWQQALQVLHTRQQLFRDAGKLLSCAEHTSIVLVMIPEMLPLAETRRAVAQLAHFHLPCRHIIVNQIMPGGDNAFWQERRERQQAILQEIRQAFSAQQLHAYALQASDIRGMDALRRFGEQGYLHNIF